MFNKNLLCACIALTYVGSTAIVVANDDDLDELRTQIEALQDRIDEIEENEAKERAVLEERIVQFEENRVDIGDLNQATVEEGAFPGAIVIPGSDNVSFAIGGFVKASVFIDTDAETQGANFLPSNLGLASPDVAGNTTFDASLSRLFFDARKTTDNGSIEGYLEWDFNANNDGSIAMRFRHAYGKWSNGPHTILFGQTWTTFMDAASAPETVTEPTLSGVVFVRQPQFRYTYNFGNDWRFNAAVEQPKTNDLRLDGNARSYRTQPDYMVNFDYMNRGGHFRVSAMSRELALRDGPNEISARGWGVLASGYVNFEDVNGRLSGQYVYGEGIQRYVIGLQYGTAGSYFADTQNIDLRTNSGGWVSYRQTWSERFRSTFGYSQTESEPLSFQEGTSEFESSSYLFANFVWQVNPSMTLGIEYNYGENEMSDGTGFDNNRFIIGAQFF